MRFGRGIFGGRRPYRRFARRSYRSRSFDWGEAPLIGSVVRAYRTGRAIARAIPRFPERFVAGVTRLGQFYARTPFAPSDPTFRRKLAERALETQRVIRDSALAPPVVVNTAARRLSGRLRR